VNFLGASGVKIADARADKAVMAPGSSADGARTRDGDSSPAEVDLVQITERLASIIGMQHDVADSRLDLEAVMRLVVERARALTGADGARVELVDGDELVVRAASGSGEPALGRRLPAAPILARAATETGVGVPDDTGHGSQIFVPLYRGGQAAGVLVATTAPESRRLCERDRQSLELLGMMLSSAVDRAAEREALARFETIFRDSPIGMGVLSLDGRIVESNEPMRAISGFTAEELAIKNVLEYTHPDWVGAMEIKFGGMLRGEYDSYRVESQILDRQGRPVWTDAAVSLVRDAAGKPQFAVLMAQDITKRVAAEAALVRQAELNAHQALHDPLTALPNRTLFRDRVEHAIQSARRDGTRPAVLIIDLDGFKEVNDSFGHAAGDTLLQVLGERLQGALRGSDTVARLGGDEFGVLIASAGVPGDVAAAIERIRSALQEPMVVKGLPLVVDGSIGVALYPEHGRDVETLVQHADAAMYAAKDRRSRRTFSAHVEALGA
jgi:diguanylate cyclase (GGDEF)-like protein/PAS domain S-box-containing protein